MLPFLSLRGVKAPK